MIFNVVEQKQAEKLKKELNVERQRINNIIANNANTDENTELIDIRVGADGKVYKTAGEAVRSQFNSVSEQINNDKAMATAWVESLGLVVKNGLLCARYNTED